MSRPSRDAIRDATHLDTHGERLPSSGRRALIRRRAAASGYAAQMAPGSRADHDVRLSIAGCARDSSRNQAEIVVPSRSGDDSRT